MSRNSAVITPKANMTLLQMLNDSGEIWPTGATCVTQDSDGCISFWDVSVNQVKSARNKASGDDCLTSILGLESQVGCTYFSIDEQDFVASDWQEAVVTLDNFIGL